MFIRELPPATTPFDVPGVKFRTRIGVPVFLAPARPVLKAEITGAAVHGGRLALTLKNAGTTRLSPGKVKIQGLGQDGKPVFELAADVWYVLAGGERIFDLPLPAPGCARARAVTVEAPVGEGSVRARVETPRGACAP